MGCASRASLSLFPDNRYFLLDMGCCHPSGRIPLFPSLSGSLGSPPPHTHPASPSPPLPHVRLLAILAGVQVRAKQGNASSPHAMAVSSDSVLTSLARAALDIIARADGAHAATPAPAADAARQPPNSGSGNGISTDASALPADAFLPTTPAVTLAAAAVGGGAGSGAGGRGGDLPPRVQQLLAKVTAFMADHVYPAEV